MDILIKKFVEIKKELKSGDKGLESGEFDIKKMVE